MADVQCVRCGRTAEGLNEPPVGGALGQKLASNVCAACYGEWVQQQVLYINHYGLQMADSDDRKKLIQEMKNFLKLDTV